MIVKKSVLEATCEKCGIVYCDCNVVIDDDGKKWILCHRCTEGLESKIFTNAEHIALSKRLNGDKRDPTSIYASRVKPKLKEMFEVWFKKKDEIEKLLE